MVEKEAIKEKEAEQAIPIDPEYNKLKEFADGLKEKALKGKKLIKGKEIPFNMNRQAIHRVYSNEWRAGITNNNWNLFIHEIRTHSGKHRHQGGLNLFVLRGKGYTVVDGRRFDWTAGDLILLPIKKGGVEHQHFNMDDRPSRWFAFVYNRYNHMIGKIFEQKESNPFWKEPA